MRTNWWSVAPLLAVGLLAGGCGSNLNQGDASVLAVIDSLEGASGAEPDDYGGVLFSDVLTLVEDTNGNLVPTIFADNARVTMTLAARNPTLPAPTNLNDVTFSRYRVVYRRTDGGSAVPAPFELGATFTVPAAGTVQFVFELVRHDAKLGAPLAPLQTAAEFIPAVADVTFFGRDQQGRDVVVTGSMGVEFGNFADPE